jgi:hypothetical protein
MTMQRETVAIGPAKQVRARLARAAGRPGRGTPAAVDAMQFDIHQPTVAERHQDGGPHPVPPNGAAQAAPGWDAR